MVAMEGTATTAQTAKLFKKTPRTIANWVKQGHLGDEGEGFIRLPGPRGAFLIKHHAIERMWHHGDTQCREHVRAIEEDD